jgi:hypothetical protein
MIAAVRSFEVLTWTESGGFVLYVPAIEALTRARHLDEVEDAARDLIAELAGLEPATIDIELNFRRPSR